jgi:exportin-1
MINQDFAEFPEHRVGFFKLIRAINLTCFAGMSDRCASPCLMLKADW